MVNRLKSIFIAASCVLFILTSIGGVLIIYDAIGVSKDGEFCEYKKDYDADYDFIAPNGLKCSLVWSGLLEPVFVFLFFHGIVQFIWWSLYGVINLACFIKKYGSEKDHKAKNHNSTG